mgnify:CR=1 FL=1
MNEVNDTITISKSVIDSIRDFFKTCPHIEDITKLNVDYLNVEGKGDYYSLEQTGEIVVKKNVLGVEKERELNFIFATRSFYNIRDNSAENSSNLAKLETISEWIREKNRKKELPLLDEEFISTDISITSGPTLYGISKSTNSARYELQGTLKYERR